MKKTFMLAFLLAAMGLFVACGDNKSKGPDGAKTEKVENPGNANAQDNQAGGADMQGDHEHNHDHDHDHDHNHNHGDINESQSAGDDANKTN